MTTITKGATTITPDLVSGYEADTESRNVLHIIIGRSTPDVSLNDDGLRSGTLSLFFAARAAAFAAHAAHTTAGTFTLTDLDIPEANMLYVRAGRMTIALDNGTRRRWVLSVGFQEVAP